jgi:peptidoglycan/xylan/chitin deacetylase (PgdA/CDA1 family)
MRRLVGIFVAACFFYSGLVRLARWWRQRSGPHLIILTYHLASGGDLRRHLLYLHHHYRMLHLEEALEELYASPGERKQGSDRRTPLVLTFDDGYHDNYTHAFALARELQIPITIFLIPGYVENGAPFWWLEAKNLVYHAQVDKVMIEGRIYYLEKAEERELLVQAIDARLRHARSVAQREEFLAHVRELLAVSSSVPVEGEAVRPLTWAEVREMDASGWVSFGGHTMHHPILAYLSSPEEVRREVEECRGVLEQQLGHPVRTFAYPLGRPEHIGKVALQAVREAGYDWAVTTINGINTPQSNPQQLRRLSGLVTRHWLVMAAEISGVWHFFSPLWKWRDSNAGTREIVPPPD